MKGLRFADGVMYSNQKFWGSATCNNNNYKRFSSSYDKFMGLQTFICDFLDGHQESKLTFVKVIFGVKKHPKL